MVVLGRLGPDEQVGAVVLRVDANDHLLADPASRAA